jgi:hypothetical protein
LSSIEELIARLHKSRVSVSGMLTALETTVKTTFKIEK